MIIKNEVLSTLQYNSGQSAILATLLPLYTLPYILHRKEMKSITSIARFFIFLHFVVQRAVSVIDEERRCRLPDGATTKKEVAIS